MSAEYYIFVREDVSTGWRMEDTIWETPQDCIDAMMQICVDYPGASVLAGYSVNGGPLVIPEMIGELKEAHRS